MAQGKTVGPATTLTFLGIELDTEKQEARLPDEKLEKCFYLVEAFLNRKKVIFGRNSRQSCCGSHCFPLSHSYPNIGTDLKKNGFSKIYTAPVFVP
jgi:hypothetical protein